MLGVHHDEHHVVANQGPPPHPRVSGPTQAVCNMRLPRCTAVLSMLAHLNVLVLRAERQDRRPPFPPGGCTRSSRRTIGSPACYHLAGARRSEMISVAAVMRKQGLIGAYDRRAKTSPLIRLMRTMETSLSSSMQSTWTSRARNGIRSCIDGIQGMLCYTC